MIEPETSSGISAMELATIIEASLHYPPEIGLVVRQLIRELERVNTANTNLIYMIEKLRREQQ